MCPVKMNAERTEWSRRYRTAMRRFLRQGKSGSLLPAARLGRRAVTLGLETLDVARLHAQALTALASSADSSGSAGHKVGEQAEVFFAETIVPIEATHRAALKAEVQIDQLTRTLRRRGNESSASARRLQRAIPQRQAAEAVREKDADQHAKLLAEAQRLQHHFRHQTRELLSAQEDVRERTSVALRNDIAQALLAIDLSLLALKVSASVNPGNVEKELAKVQRLVGELRDRGFAEDPSDQ
ncbi:MAG: hypothetical protein E4H01_17085 [Lysobacterales bacterium]|nr:MAG: hypothetical protein E4H01_17085 [Xanthomonadales bacterium]